MLSMERQTIFEGNIEIGITTDATVERGHYGIFLSNHQAFHAENDENEECEFPQRWSQRQQTGSSAKNDVTLSNCIQDGKG